MILQGAKLANLKSEHQANVKIIKQYLRLHYYAINVSTLPLVKLGLPVELLIIINISCCYR